MSFGVISGIVVGFGYLPSLYIAWTYFPNHKSTVTGCILFFAGLSTLILAPLSTGIVNPNNYDPSDPRVTERVPLMWYWISGIYFIIWIVSVSLQPQPWVAEEQKEEKVNPRKSSGPKIHTVIRKESEERIKSPLKKGGFVNTIKNKLNKKYSDPQTGSPNVGKKALESPDKNKSCFEREINIIPKDS